MGHPATTQPLDSAQGRLSRKPRDLGHSLQSEYEAARVFRGKSLPPPHVRGEWRDRISDRTAWASRQFVRRDWRSLFERAEQRGIIHADPEGHEPVFGAHGLQQALLAQAQHLYRKGPEIAEHPQQVQPLTERGFQVTRPEWSHHSQHACRKFFKPHICRPEIVRVNSEIVAI